MNKINGYDEAQVITSTEKLPADGYVTKIIDTKIDKYDWGEVLVLALEILEGDYAGFFTKDFARQTGEQKKWRGTYRITIPTGNGSDADNWKLRILKTAITSIEESNASYKWNWDESTLKNKIVGAIFREKEYEYNNKRGMYTECYTLRSADTIRKGEFEIPKPKMLEESELSKRFAEIPDANNSFLATPDDELPFG